MSYRRDGETTGVSPVVAVILLVAVTVTLSAVIGGFALNLGQSTTSSNSQQNIGISTSQTDGQYTATIVTGSADKVKLLVNGTEADSITNASAGDTLTANATAGSDVTIITISDGESTVTTSTTISETTTSSGTGATAPTDGLVAYYEFNTTLTDSVGGYDLANATSLGFGSGKLGSAKEFDGTNDYANRSSVSDFQFDDTDSFTISAWVRPQNTSTSQTITFLHSNVGDGNFEVRLRIESNGKIAGGTCKSGTACDMVSGSTLSTGMWYHAVLVSNGSTVTLYLNSAVENTTSPYTAGRSVGNIDVGGNHKNSQSYLDGHIDELRVYNQSLNQSEVNDLYNATK